MGNKKKGTGNFDTLGIQAPQAQDLIPPPEQNFVEKLSREGQLSAAEARDRNAQAMAHHLKVTPPHGRPGKHRF